MCPVTLIAALVFSIIGRRIGKILVKKHDPKSWDRMKQGSRRKNGTEVQHTEFSALGEPDDVRWTDASVGEGMPVYVFTLADGIQISFYSDDTGSKLSD